jgi:hypothetical protein
MVEGFGEATVCQTKYGYYVCWLLESYLRLKEPTKSTSQLVIKQMKKERKEYIYNNAGRWGIRQLFRLVRGGRSLRSFLQCL